MTRIRLLTFALVCSACPGPGDVMDGSMNGIDGGTDAAMSVDAAQPPAAPVLRWPANGAYTGSSYAPITSPLTDHPLTPKLMWEPVAGATEYRVQIDDCGTDPFRTCAFASPEIDANTPGTAAPSGTALQYRPPLESLGVSGGPPVGRRYVWRIAACNAAGCGSFSEPRYMNVGRLANDYNGDGRGDLVVGAYAQSNQAPSNFEGNVFVYYGINGRFGSATDPDVRIDSPQDQADAQFGSSVASAGDLNGDGFSDLVIGASLQDDVGGDTNQGRAFVYYGGPGGFGANPVPDSTIANPTDQVDGYFGVSVASAGDVNGDGYDDLLVGAHGQTDDSTTAADEGHAFVYLGGPAGLGSDPSPTITIDNPTNQVTGEFGRYLAGAGDLNGDGVVDLVIGAHFQDGAGSPKEGHVYVYHGAAGGLIDRPAPDASLDNPTNQPYGYFGGAVAGAGDLDGDGNADLVIGAPGQEAEEGAAFIYYGRAGGFGSNPTHDAKLGNPTNQSTSRFAHSIASAGDLDADGHPDLVIGAPMVHDSLPAEDGEGHAYIYYGSAVRFQGDVTSADDVLDNPEDESGANFGRAVAGGDPNGDGYADIVVGAPKLDNVEADEGNAFVYYGASGGLDPAYVRLDNPDDQAGGYFGAALASVLRDLRIGADPCPGSAVNGDGVAAAPWAPSCNTTWRWMGAFAGPPGRTRVASRRVTWSSETFVWFAI